MQLKANLDEEMNEANERVWIQGVRAQSDQTSDRTDEKMEIHLNS